ncbi:NAD(P)H-dependent oxidoreductase [Candidatus Falkowbacteria bacterium CG10_big_fil_rev_8_21_14_0_10_37_14]|uniref:NAD(P)H-dependent oxidoreductase n=1 Tax=Candidatus Falkowbacteria bacterium CG10_big_fil_rev_8_21_14_0_10_37_14 TaxID=1974561 RepID=A0A2M6WTJ3_9BACT|nr:NAD(P)H-dependent oxidoreductase [Candidatus Falkowbacteria bacterium]PIT96112.1 MAG: NAD(P)H-dependent oxidoreductase [Candidatus Falkowbacteria bacterium CG10_big_fil_rev_8_21_14_0_10_37_14]
MSFIENLGWRYATKKFDVEKKVTAENLEKILEAMRLAPSSFGLQPYHFYVIANIPENQEKLQAIKTASWGQAQIDTCSHLIVMAGRNDLMAVKDEYFELASGGDVEVRTKMVDYEKMVADFVLKATVEWSKKQVYIALGFAMAACAELAIDSCPMEGFDGQKVAEILGVPTNHENTVFLPIGYRSTDDTPRRKTRFAKDQLFTEL